MGLPNSLSKPLLLQQLHQLLLLSITHIDWSLVLLLWGRHSNNNSLLYLVSFLESRLSPLWIKIRCLWNANRNLFSSSAAATEPGGIIKAYEDFMASTAAYGDTFN